MKSNLSDLELMQIYEREKKLIASLGLTPEEYESRIKESAKFLGV